MHLVYFPKINILASNSSFCFFFLREKQGLLLLGIELQRMSTDIVSFYN